MEDRDLNGMKPYLEKLTLGVTRLLGEWQPGPAPLRVATVRAVPPASSVREFRGQPQARFRFPGEAMDGFSLSQP